MVFTGYLKTPISSCGLSHKLRINIQAFNLLNLEPVIEFFFVNSIPDLKL